MGNELLAREICKLPDADDIFLHAVASDGLHARYLSQITDLIDKKKDNDRKSAKTNMSAN